jgi:hypothetical protein
MQFAFGPPGSRDAPFHVAKCALYATDLNFYEGLWANWTTVIKDTGAGLIGTVDPYVSIYGSVTCKMDDPKPWGKGPGYVNHGCDFGKFSNAITNRSECAAAAKSLGLTMGTWNYQIAWMAGCYRGYDQDPKGKGVSVFWGETKGSCNPGSQHTECLCKAPAVKAPRFPAGQCSPKGTKCSTLDRARYCCLPNVCNAPGGGTDGTCEVK